MSEHKSFWRKGLSLAVLAGFAFLLTDRGDKLAESAMKWAAGNWWYYIGVFLFLIACLIWFAASKDKVGWLLPWWWPFGNASNGHKTGGPRNKDRPKVDDKEQRQEKEPS